MVVEAFPVVAGLPPSRSVARAESPRVGRRTHPRRAADAWAARLTEGTTLTRRSPQRYVAIPLDLPPGGKGIPIPSRLSAARSRRPPGEQPQHPGLFPRAARALVPRSRMHLARSRHPADSTSRYRVSRHRASSTRTSRLMTILTASRNPRTGSSSDWLISHILLLLLLNSCSAFLYDCTS